MNNCNQIAKNILMEEHVWYKYRFPIAIIIGFFIGIVFHSPKVFGRSCIISMLAASVVYYGIEYYAQMIVDNNRIQNLVERCQSMSNTHVRAKVDASDSILRKDTQNIIDKYSDVVLDKVSEEKFRNPYANINSNYESLQSDPVPSPPAQVGIGGCLLGNDECSPVCSGSDTNPCNLQLSTPGPQWQVQSANSVQNRLNNGQFVPNYCPL